tara:strand:- start:242 stop:418 length:177 start_codon:yes stop_codon:yes gene_type:complete
MGFKELIHDKLTYGDSVEDSSLTDNSFDIKSYTYEFYIDFNEFLKKPIDKQMEIIPDI